MPRAASIRRNTKETQIELRVNLDGRGQSDISTGIPFFDHMLDLVARHGGFDLRLRAKGDLHVDQHHTVEDVGIALGEVLYGRSSHHQVEALFKAFARALRFAVARDKRLRNVLPSTKQLL